MQLFRVSVIVRIIIFSSLFDLVKRGRRRRRRAKSLNPARRLHGARYTCRASGEHDESLFRRAMIWAARRAGSLFVRLRRRR